MSKLRKTSRTRPRRATRKATRRARARSRGKIDLGPIHTRLKGHLGRLKRTEQTTQVRNALRRLQRCLDEMQKTCGPDMVIPLG